MSGSGRRVAAPGRVVRLVMRLDKAGSFAYYPAVLAGSIVVLAVFHPHGVLLGLIWAVLGLFGLWLGVLGVCMACGLAGAMRRGEEIDAEWYASLFPELRPRSADDGVQ